jgi:AhpD family alkylhydroperoxidase
LAVAALQDFIRKATFMLLKGNCAAHERCNEARFLKSNLQEIQTMMLNWNEYQKQIGTTLVELAKLSPDTLRGYRTLSDANAKTSLLGAKVRELISLAVAVTTHCDGCIVIHTDLALKAGATREEIAETLGVTVAMNAGAAMVYSTRVLDAVAAKSAPTEQS